MPRAKKQEKKIIQMHISMKKVDMENHIISGSFSNENMDRHGEIVFQNWDLKNFKKNPVILNSHNYGDITEILGRAINLSNDKDKKELVGDIQFAVSQNPKAKIAFDLFAGGFANAFSVGFIPLEFDKDGNILKSELLEISLVSVPANALALAKSKGIDVDQLYGKSNADNQDTEGGDDGGHGDDDSEDSGNESGGDTDGGDGSADELGDDNSEEERGTDLEEEKEEEEIKKPEEEVEIQTAEEMVEEVKSIKQSPNSIVHNAIKSEVEKRKLALQRIYSAVKLVSEHLKVDTRLLNEDDRADTKLLLNRTIRALHKLK